jgi:hypothetical protein
MKTAYKFIKYPDPDNCHSFEKIVISTEYHALDLEQMADMFEDFLKACGFSGGLSVTIESGDVEE